MTNKEWLKKVSLAVLSASVAFSGMPAAAMAADFSDAEIVAEADAAEETSAVDAEVEAEAAEDTEAEAAVEEETAEAAGETAETEENAAADEFTSDDEFSDEAGVEEEYKYVYAGLKWDEYWSAEGVAEATNTTKSDVQDSNGEYDKGAFDAVTRATSRHGVHRGSFQTIATVFAVDGSEYKLAGWKDQTTAILTDGSEVTLADGSVDGKEMDHYEVYGLKYVPVKVASADYDAFKAKYDVVENGGTLFGGYGEGTLSSYSYIADVNENTNGLKTAVKSGDGFTFSARQNGTGSGLKDVALRSAEADGAKVEVQEANGSYGEFLRVDIKGDNGEYAGLGASMQAVKWVYYGTDNTYTNAIATYGTKFASDNWFHKKNGIQLGLTDSIRCQLPEGTDGTGYWKVTVYGLGYQDYTFTFQATEANIVKATGNADATALQAEVDKAKALNEADYTADSWLTFKGELEECEEMIANLQNYTQAAVDEQITHLTSAMSGLVKKEVKSVKLDKASATVKVGKTTTLKATVDANTAYTVTWKSSKTSVATVDANGKVTAVAKGTATITATAGDKTATCKITVPNPVSVTGTTLYLKGTPAKATLKVTKDISGTAKFSSNSKAVSVNNKGVVTAKKAGTATITVTVGKYKATCKVVVKNPSITAKAAASTVKVGKTTTIKVTKNGVTGTAKFTSSNKNVATVSSKGVVKAKKAGTVKITVKVGKYTKTVTVKVKK